MTFKYDPETDPFTLYAFELAVQHGFRMKNPELQAHMEAARKRLEERGSHRSDTASTDCVGPPLRSGPSDDPAPDR